VLNGGALSTLFIPDTEEVTGSIPVSPTTQDPYSAAIFVVFSWGTFKKRPLGPYCDPQ